MRIEIDPDYPTRIFKKNHLRDEVEARQVYVSLVESARDNAYAARHAWRKWKETPPTGPAQDSWLSSFFNASHACLRITRDAGTLRRLISKWWPR